MAKRGATTGGLWPSAVRENFHVAASNDPAEPQLWCYTDRMSYAPGDPVRLHMNATVGPVRIAVFLDDGSFTEVFEDEVEAHFAETPDQASVEGCGWPVALELRIPADWPSGGYVLRAEAADDDGRLLRWHHWFALRAGAAPGDVLQVAATSTWLAYNDWGGSNHYEGICGPNRDRPAFSVTTERPWTRGFCWLPPGAPRAVLAGPVAPGAAPRYPHMEWAYANGWSKKYASAGWATYDRHFAAWGTRQGLKVDLATQHDLHFRPEILDRYKAVVAVGHDEYWSWPMRDAVDDYVERGGHLVRLGGNFLWQVRLEDEGRTQTCYKYWAHALDPVRDTERQHLLTSAWDDPAVGRPAARTVGVSALRGIYANVGLCTPRGPGGFVVYRPEHWAFAGTDLRYGDLIGDRARIFGYEVDGLDYVVRDGLPFATEADDPPQGLEILAMGLATCVEEVRGHEETDWFLGADDGEFVARILYGDASPENVARTNRGSGMIVAFARGKGEVFTAGTCEWVSGLAQGEPTVERVTRNVLERALGR